jgi:hypothetical protein
VLLQQPQGGFEVGGLGEPAAGGGHMGIPAAELGPVGAADPVEQPAGVVGAGVGAHQVEHGLGVLDEVVGQPDGGGEGVGGDRPGPAVAEVAGQVQEGGEAAGGAGELGCPAGQLGEVAAAGGQPGLQIALEGEQQLGRRRVEGLQGRPVVGGGDGQAGRQGLQPQRIAVGHRRRDGWGAGLAAADQTLREAVQEPGEQPPATEPGPTGQPTQDLGLDRQADGQAGPLDVLGWAAAAVDLEQVAGVALEVDAEVRAAGLVVAAGHLVEHVPSGDNKAMRP